MNRLSNSSSLQVLAVRTSRDLGRFIDLPWDIYADDPAWVPPLRIERRLHFSRFNPFFEHGTWQAWLALKGGSPVGRISAQVDRLHREFYGADTGHFGLLESVDDPCVVAELLRAAEDWLRGQGTRRVSGPFNFSINQECGLLVEGFDTPPVIMMPHARRWYAPMLERQGYSPAQELFAYWANVDFRP
ncbi:MAG: N-acetyltransferase, partial [Gammaproteobacteria bacterium]